MKVYTRVVLDLNGNIIEEDSYEYSGPVAKCKGGSTKVSAPKPSATELAIQEEQLKSIRAQNLAVEQITPILLKSMGYVYENVVTPENRARMTYISDRINYLDEKIANPPVAGEDHKVSPFQAGLAIRYKHGDPTLVREWESERDELQRELESLSAGTQTMRPMTEEERLSGMTDTERMEYENYKLGLERQRKALKGELPVSEATVRQKNKEWQIFKESQARMGNVITGDTPEEGSATGDAGIKSVQAFKEYWGMREDAERRGELTEGTANVLNMGGFLNESDRSKYASLAMFPSIRNATDWSTALQPYQYNRGMEYQASAANAANRSSFQNTALSGLFTMGGLGLYKWSSKELKENIKKVDDKKVLEMVKKGNTYTYNYKGDNPDNKQIGVMAEEAPGVYSDGKRLDIGNYLGFLDAATRELAKKVARLEKKKGGKK